MVLDTHMRCIELRVPQLDSNFSKLLIYSNDARVKTVVSYVKDALSELFADSFEFYALYLPSLSDPSVWLKDERTLASYELDVHVFSIFSCDLLKRISLSLTRMEGIMRSCWLLQRPFQ
jgi:hypothetical protein